MKNITAPLTRLAVAAALILATMSEGLADEVRLYREGAIPDPAMVARVLRGPQRTRGVVLDPVTPADGGQDVREAAGNAPTAAAAPTAVAHTAGIVADASGSGAASSTPERPIAAPAKAATGTHHAGNRATVLALMIKFGNDSAMLESGSEAPLDAVAKGIRMAGLNQPIVIEGHANATGSPNRNRALSQARAEAVRRYLVEQGGVPSALLLAKGYGAERPLIGRTPRAAENRRVQFRALSA